MASREGFALLGQPECELYQENMETQAASSYIARATSFAALGHKRASMITPLAAVSIRPCGWLRVFFMLL